MSKYTLVDYLQSLSPAMATSFMRGHVETLDSYDRARVITVGTAGIGLAWQKDGKCWYLNQEKSATAGGGHVSIADSGAAPELRIASGTIFWAARNFKATTADIIGATRARVYSKLDGGGTDIEIFIWGTNQIAIYDGTSVRTITSTGLAGAKTCAVRFTSGGTPVLFTDGCYRGAFSGTITPPGNDANLCLMNTNTASYGSRVNAYSLFAGFNDALRGSAITAEEIKNLHEAYVEILSVFEPERKIFLPRALKDVLGTAPVAEFAGKPNANNVVPDASGNGNDFTVSGGPLTVRSDKGHHIWSSYGRGGATAGPIAETAVNAALYSDPWTIVLKGMVRTIGENNAGRLMEVSNNGSGAMVIVAKNTPVTQLSYQINYNGSYYDWRASLTPNVEHIVTIRHTKSDKSLPAIDIDGKSVTVTVQQSQSGSLYAAPNAILNIFQRGDAGMARAFDGELEVVGVFSGLLSDAQVRKIYLEHALECNVLANRTDDPISLAAVSAGGKGGPWRVLSGTHKWDDDGTRRRLLGVTASWFASRRASSQAYGAWYLRAAKGTDAGTTYYPLVASDPNKTFGVSGQNAYAIRFTADEKVRLAKWTGAVDAVIAETALPAIAVGTEYELFVTRQSVATSDGAAAGYWTVWIRGGAYTTWTSLLTGTDNTHTTSTCLVGYLDAGGTLSDVQLFPNGGSLDPSEVPWLAAA